MKRSSRGLAATEYIDALHLPERRTHLRHQPLSIVYVELDEGNGGIALNISETGLAVQSVMPVVDDFLSRVRFQLSESKEWIEASAQVVWANESRKLLGLRFVDLPEAPGGLIREWLHREILPNMEGDGPQVLSEGLEGRAAPPHLSIPALAMDASEITPPPSMSAMPPPPILTFSEALADIVPPPEVASKVEEAGRIPACTDATHAGTPAGSPDGSAQAKPVTSFKPESFRFPSKAVGLPNRGSVAIFFLFLATASLATGWLVGRGTLAGGIGMLRRIVFRGGAGGSADADLPDQSGGAAHSPEAPQSLQSPRGRVSEIEIINSANDSWTIPLAGFPFGAGGTRRDSSDSPSSPVHSKSAPLKMWVLSAPLQPRTVDSDSNAAAPPAVGASTEPAQGTLPSVGQPTLAAPPPLKQSDVKHAQLIRSVDPDYPALALSRRVQGVVKMHLTITASGRVRDIRVLNGPIELTGAAMNAASQWIFSPALIDGKPTDSEMDISMTFRLP